MTFFSTTAANWRRGCARPGADAASRSAVANPGVDAAAARAASAAGSALSVAVSRVMTGEAGMIGGWEVAAIARRKKKNRSDDLFRFFGALYQPLLSASRARAATMPLEAHPLPDADAGDVPVSVCGRERAIDVSFSRHVFACAATRVLSATMQASARPIGCACTHPLVGGGARNREGRGVSSGAHTALTLSLLTTTSQDAPPPSDPPTGSDNDGDAGPSSNEPSPHSRRGHRDSRRGVPTPVAAVALAVLGLLAAALASRRRRRPKPPSAALLTSYVDATGALAPTPVAAVAEGAPPPPPRPLDGRTAIFSPLLRAPEYEVSGRDLAVAAAASAGGGFRNSRTSLDAARSTGAAPAPAVAALAAAGATVLGFATDDELASGPLAPPRAPAASTTPNPAWPHCAPLGGPGARAAAAVAGGVADIALGLDGGAGLASQAAVQGLAALRATAGAGPRAPPPPPGPGPLASLTLAARSLTDVAAAAAALGLPGAAPGAPRPPPGRVVVAEDLFEGCSGPGAAAMTAAVRRAAARWAPDMVGGGLIATYLRDTVPAAARFLSPEEAAAGAVLRGMRRASDALRGADLLEAHGRALLKAGGDAATPPPRPAPRGVAAVGDGDAALEDARAVWEEAGAGLKHVLGAGAIVVAPALPGEPPSVGARAADAERWAQGAAGLACVTAFGGLPCVVIPLPTTAKDGPPACVALWGGAGADGALLDVATRFAPLLAEEHAAALAAPRGRGSGSGDAGTSPVPSPPATLSRGGRAAAATAARVAAAAAAAALREEGNAAFRAGDYEAAAARYTEAAAADPRCAPSQSNLAAANLKLLRFEEAERAASASLALSLSAKALLRRGTARAGLGDGASARADLKHVLVLEPGNRQARSELAALDSAERALSGGDVAAASGSGPCV